MNRVLAGLAMVLVAVLGATLHAAESPAPYKDRAGAIAATLCQVKAQAQAHGGWDEWYKKLAPFREGLVEATKGKWPWPAKNGFSFYGQSAMLLRMEGWASHSQDPAAAVISLDRQLKARGIDLIFVLIPDKLAIYPDYLVPSTPADRMVFVQSTQLIHRLSEADVEAVDLFTPYHAYRSEHGDELPLYLKRDGHWNNRGARLAAEHIARHLMRYDFVAKAKASEGLYDTKKGARNEGAKADDDLLHVLRKDGSYYVDSPDSPIVLTGDSFSMYNMNSGAHLSAQVARLINMPVTYVCREGLAQDMPIELARRDKASKFLNGRKVILWTLRGRSLGEKGWVSVDLAGQAAMQAMVQNVKATGEVVAVSQRPSKTAPYVNYIMELHVKDLKDSSGKPIGDGEATVHVLAMRNREVLPIAQVQPGEKLQMQLTTWSSVKAQYEKVNAGVLPDTLRAQFWADLGQASSQPTTGITN